MNKLFNELKNGLINEWIEEWKKNDWIKKMNK